MAPEGLESENGAQVAGCESAEKNQADCGGF